MYLCICIWPFQVKPWLFLTRECLFSKTAQFYLFFLCSGLIAVTTGEWSAQVLIRCFPDFKRRWILALYRFFRESLKNWAGTEMVVLIKLKRRCSTYNERIRHLQTTHPMMSQSLFFKCLLLLLQLRKSLKKSRRPALGSFNSNPSSSSDPAHRLQLSDTDGSGKENPSPEEHVLLSSDDEDFDKCKFWFYTVTACMDLWMWMNIFLYLIFISTVLAAKATPKSTFKQSAPAAQKPRWESYKFETYFTIQLWLQTH